MGDRERMAAGLPRFWAARVASCGGVVHEVDGLVVCLTGVPDDPFNPTLVVDDPVEPAAALADAAARYPRGLSFGIDLEPSIHAPVRAAAGGAGLTMVESRPGMAMRIADLPSVPTPDGVTIRRVEEPETLDELARVDAAAFGGDPALSRAFLPDAVLDDPSQREYVALVDGGVVAVGGTAIADGVLGVFGIATLEPFRRRGIGAALTAAVIADRADDADLAVLQTSPLGRGVYGTLGFRSISTWEVWSAG